MRRVILVLAVCLGVMAVASSCKDKEQKQSEESHIHEDGIEEHVSMIVYQCPMDCEEGKTYDKEDKCPVCGMDLKKVESEDDSDHNDDHDPHDGHDNDTDH